MTEQAAHEIMARVTIPATVNNEALCAAIQRQYDEGPMPCGGFILKGGGLIYFAVVLDEPTFEQEKVYFREGMDEAMRELGGSYEIESISPEMTFSEIEAY